MTTSRAESQHQYGRRRSNTAQSILRNAGPVQPLKFGDTKVLNPWVHDSKESPAVTFNHTWWPGVAEGDVLRVTSNNNNNSDNQSSGFYFVVPKDEGCPKPQLQISIPKPIADKFGLRNNIEVTLTKVDKDTCSADYVEFVFQDQYIGRNDMWRFGQVLVGQCVYVDQEISFAGSITAKIQGIYIGGKKVSAAYVTSTTKSIHRTLSAKVTIFIQVCRELWEFAGDGERYNEKIVHSFLPALFTKWREAGTNHTVTIVLISRVYYDQSEIDYAAGPLRRDDEGNWYKDFYKIITDLEVIYEWKPTLVGLKVSFWDFQRDILLAHHHHRSLLEPSVMGPTDQVRLVGRLSFAHDGPILEALNLGLNPNETHYIDRSLSLTGASTILITPGTGYFRVSKQLLRLTTTRMLDQGFGLDLVSLAKPPLHQSPIFSFLGVEPELKLDREGKGGGRTMDPLWGGDDDPSETLGREKTKFWWEPFWISMSFWDMQMDLPFREDRFIARAKMHEIQMLGLLEHDVLATIEIPLLADSMDPLATPRDGVPDGEFSIKEQANKFDMDVFALKKDTKPPYNNRNSFASSASGTITSSSFQSSSMRRSMATHRSSLISSRIGPIEESPRLILKELPPEIPSQYDHMYAAASIGGLSSSPSQSSVLSVQSNKSASTSSSATNPTQTGTLRGSIKSKFAPSWLFNPFRSGPSEPQTTVTSASAVTSLAEHSAAPRQPPAPMATVAETTLPPPPNPMKPMKIKGMSSARSTLSRNFDEETLVSNRGFYTRHSPINTPPREETLLAKRRAMTLPSSTTGPFASPSSLPNPSRFFSSISYVQSSLARRWQHIFAQPTYKHEIKWGSLVTPGCLPLTVEHFPTTSELETSYDVFSYDFVVDPHEMRSFLVKSPNVKGNVDDIRRAWALVVMRGMAAVRLAQGFQFVLRPQKTADDTEEEDKAYMRRSKSFMGDDENTPKPAGAAEVLRSTDDPVYLSMSNEIHRISYTGEAIQVRRYVRRMPASQPIEYQCLIWPKLGVGYTELKTSFTSHGLENYGWNRLDMLVAGYEHQFNESLRYWRTRFVVIPTADPPSSTIGPSGEILNDEETRLLGIDKLAEIFSKLRWNPPEEKNNYPPIRFLPTTLGPATSVLDESLMTQLDEIHAAGPLRKKMKSEREISELPLAAIVKAMREEDGVPIKNYQWHHIQYPDAFTGFDFVSWLVREFRDVSSRAQGAEWGVKLQEQGLLEHCRGFHGFLDGHYFYRLKAEYAVPSTPRSWFRSNRHNTEEIPNGRSFYPSNIAKSAMPSPRKHKKRLILSQSMVIDIDPNKKSDQAETVILHHDIIHNPATVFHFELQWIGTTARLIEEQLRRWSGTIELYGLKLVEAYVTQISDIRDQNAFQSCFPLRLAKPPLIVPDLEKRIPEGTQATHYFEYALLRKFGFILDVEAAALYPELIDVIYSYRRSPLKYSQFIHRTGVAFVQVLGGSQGFLFLTNRLMGPGRMGTALKSKEQRPAAAAEEIRARLSQFCADAAALTAFYDEELALLPEEPPPLSI